MTRKQKLATILLVVHGAVVAFTIKDIINDRKMKKRFKEHETKHRKVMQKVRV